MEFGQIVLILLLVIVIAGLLAWGITLQILYKPDAKKGKKEMNRKRKELEEESVKKSSPQKKRKKKKKNTEEKCVTVSIDIPITSQPFLYESKIPAGMKLSRVEDLPDDVCVAILKENKLLFDVPFFEEIAERSPDDVLGVLPELDSLLFRLLHPNNVVITAWPLERVSVGIAGAGHELIWFENLIETPESFLVVPKGNVNSFHFVFAEIQGPRFTLCYSRKPEEMSEQVFPLPMHCVKYQNNFPFGANDSVRPLLYTFYTVILYLYLSCDNRIVMFVLTPLNNGCYELELDGLDEVDPNMLRSSTNLCVCKEGTELAMVFNGRLWISRDFMLDKTPLKQVGDAFSPRIVDGYHHPCMLFHACGIYLLVSKHSIYVFENEAWSTIELPYVDLGDMTHETCCVEYDAKTINVLQVFEDGRTLVQILKTQQAGGTVLVDTYVPQFHAVMSADGYGSTQPSEKGFLILDEHMNRIRIQQRVLRDVKLHYIKI